MIHRGFHGLPRRRVVKRPCAWLQLYRRLATNYEELPATSEALVFLAMSRLMVKGLAYARTFSDSLYLWHEVLSISVSMGSGDDLLVVYRALFDSIHVLGTGIYRRQ
jgi:hypothetical protein